MSDPVRAALAELLSAYEQRIPLRERPELWAAAREALSTPPSDLGNSTERAGDVPPMAGTPTHAPMEALQRAGWVRSSDGKRLRRIMPEIAYQEAERMGEIVSEFDTPVFFLLWTHEQIEAVKAAAAELAGKIKEKETGPLR